MLTCRTIDVNDNIQERLASVRVEISHTLTKFVDISREQLVCISDTIVQVCHFVVCVASENEV